MKACAKCGEEFDDYGSPKLVFIYCGKCKESAPGAGFRRMANPRQFLSELLLCDTQGNRASIIGVESDVGATRVYVASQEGMDEGVVVMHYIRTEELILTDELKVKLGVQP